MRAVRNTELMLDSSTRALAANGWASFTLARVAREMGISERPVRNRAKNRSDLAAITWTERSGPLLVAAVERCMAGLNQARETGDSGDLCSALMAMLSRGIELDAAAELLICSNFDPDVAEAVDADLAPLVRRLITPGKSLSPDDAARAAYVLALAFGLLFMARYPRAQSKRVGEALPVWVGALTSDATAQPLPKKDARHIDVSPVLAADDPALDALLNSTLELVGTRGFHGVTVAEIARQAGFTEGLVFNRYSSKLDMFIDATRRQNEAGWKLNHDFAMALEDDFGQGIAEAVMIREAQKPGRDLGRNMALEQVRMTWHDPDLAAAARTQMDDFRADLLKRPGWGVIETEGDFTINIATSLGTYALPRLAPKCFKLPWDVVTMPLFAAFVARATA